MSGLITGGDIINQLKDKDLGDYLFIPVNMLRAETNVFLDDVTIDDVERELGVKVIPTPCDGFELLDIILEKQ